MREQYIRFTDVNEIVNKRRDRKRSLFSCAEESKTDKNNILFENRKGWEIL